MNLLISLSYFMVNNFKITDFDEIDLSNLNQQKLYSPEDICYLKMNITKKRLLQVNPKINIQSYRIKLEYLQELSFISLKETEYPKKIDKINKIIKWDNNIVSALDYYGALYKINELCVKYHKLFY